MLKEWQKFAGWKILKHFLEYPTQEFYIREISRVLKLSSASAHIYCNSYEKDGILISEKKANAKMFKLNNASPLVKTLKKFHFLTKLEDFRFAKKILDKNPYLISLAIYGSYASGEYDEQSDLDVFIISDKSIEREPLAKLEKKLGKPIQLTELTLSKWISMKNKNDPFIFMILTNHILLKGAKL